MSENELLDILNQNYPIRFYSIELLREGGCISYKVFSENEIYFLKRISQVFFQTAFQSIDILLFLEGKDILTPHILCTKKSKPYVEIEEHGRKYILILFDYIEGSEPESEEDLEEIGAVVGRLHYIMKDYQGSLSNPGKEYYIERYLHILKQKNYPEDKIAQFRQYGDELWERIENLTKGFCHGDLHRGNLLKTPNGEIYVLDFDTASWSFPMYDIMIMCNATDYFDYKEENYDKTIHILHEFLRGYERNALLDKKEIEAVTDLIAVYHYQLQATIIEIYGLDCVDEQFLDAQLDWLLRWKRQSEVKHYRVAALYLQWDNKFYE